MVVIEIVVVFIVMVLRIEVWRKEREVYIYLGWQIDSCFVIF